MDKAIEIKRRAQRCVQNGDLDGALSEYEKLVAVQDSDPYNFVLLADLLFKKGDTAQASSRYLSAATAYETNGLYKNAIAVCKKMMRLSLAQLEVMGRLANLHALDGLSTESSLYYMQYADLLINQNEFERAIESLEKAFQVSPENIKALEKLGEARILNAEPEAAARTLHDAAMHYDRAGQLADAERCRRRAQQVSPGVHPDGSAPAHEHGAPAAPAASAPVLHVPEPGAREFAHEHASEREPDAEPVAEGPAALAPSHAFEIESTSLAESVAPQEHAGPPRLPSEAYASEPEVEDEAPVEVEAPVAEAEEAMAEAEVAEAEVAEAEEAEAPSANGHGPHEVADETPEAPSLGPSAAAPVEPPHEPAGEPVTLASVEHLLAEAQEHFRAGQREAASHSLAGAAQAYEQLGRLDSAATIYRSLGKSAHATPEILMLWLGNCERRGDGVEAAQVACELGDRALNVGDTTAAGEWFQRALAMDADNDLSKRRLQRLATASAPSAAPVATLTETAPDEAEVEPQAPHEHETPSAAEAVTPSAAESTDAGESKPAEALPEAGRVEVAVGRGEAVTFDLGALISEFQRGVDAQLSGDAQSHYDLGMAYREMGLLEQAVDSFRIALQDVAYRDRCVEMIGRCLLDQGRFEDAAQAFQEAIDEGTDDPSVLVNLRYLLGLAFEAAGRTSEALTEFERVYATQSSYADVALKIRVLRKTLETL